MWCVFIVSSGEFLMHYGLCDVVMLSLRSVQSDLICKSVWYQDHLVGFFM